MEKEVAKKTKDGEKFWQKHRTAIMVVTIFAIYLIIQLRYIGDTWFDPDELDIYTVGFEMFKGKTLYADIPSQHMPWSYIISMVFYALGAHTTVLQRLYFYIFFAAFWTAFVFIYKKHVNKWVLFLQPFMFFAIIQNLEFGTQIISEHIGVIGAQMLLLEFLMFIDKKDISLASAIRISLGIIFSFGVSFINIYSIFYLALGVIVLEIVWNRKKKTTEEKNDKKNGALGQFIKLVGIVVLPWVALLIYMIASHSLDDFIMGAYTVNRVYYPNYMNGVGSDPVGMFDVGITRIAEYINQFSLEGFNTFYVLKLFIVACLMYMPYKLGKKKGWIVAVTVFMFVTSLGLRGFFSYHTIAFIGAACLVTTYAMITFIYESKEAFAKKSELVRFWLVFISILFIAAFAENLHYVLHFLRMDDMNGYKKECEIVATITDEDERFWQTNTCNSICWGAQRVTEGPTVSSPYMWEAIGINDLEEFKKNPTRVITFTEDYESWGYKMSDYAPEAYQFIIDNYTYIPDSNQVWVRNDYYEEACVKLGIN